MSGKHDQSTWRGAHPQTPTPQQIRRAIASIQQSWGPSERAYRQHLAGVLQRRLLRAAVQSAA
jgi:hypothetical protein